jgi:hypothetical protein
MRRRKLLLVLAGLAVVLCAAVAFVLWPRPDRVTRENFDRIHDRMSRSEVESILGSPGDYSTGPTLEVFRYTRILPFGPEDIPPSDWWGVWQGDSGEARIWGGSGFIRVKEFEDMYRIDQSRFDNLIWRAKRQWYCWFPDKD